jgi:hypothetical protein
MRMILHPPDQLRLEMHRFDQAEQGAFGIEAGQDGVGAHALARWRA